MNSETKVKIQNITNSVMTFIIALIVLWFIAFAISMTFDLNVFQKRTSEFLMIFIVAAFVIVLCSAVLSVSLNISLIADARHQQPGTEKRKNLNRKYLAYFISVVAAMILILFAGDALSRKRQKDNLFKTSEDIVAQYSKSIYSILETVNDTSRYDQISEQIDIISNSREEFPSVKILSYQFYNGQLVFTEYGSDLSSRNRHKSIIKAPIYMSNSEDTEYLKDVFLNNNTEKLFYYHDDNYYLYYPIIKKSNKIVIRFSKFTRYGSYGS